MSNPTEEYLNRHSFQISQTGTALPTATGSNLPWNCVDFSANFPDFKHLVVKQSEFTRITVPILFALIGKPLCKSSTVTEACLAVIASMTPIDMSDTDILRLYNNRVAIMGGQGTLPARPIINKLPICKIPFLKTVDPKRVSKEIQKYLTECTEGTSWVAATAPSSIKEYRDAYFDVESATFASECDTIAQLWNDMGDGYAYDERGLALMAVSLYLSGVIKGLEGLKSRMATWKFVTQTFPTENFLSQSFGAQRKVIATTLCVMDYLVSRNILQLSADSRGQFEKFILIRFRNVRLSLPSTVDAARRSLGMDMGIMVTHLLTQSTESSWNRLWKYATIIDTETESVTGGVETEAEFSSLSAQKIPSFVTPYMRLFNDKCMSEFGTKGNEMLVSICAGLSSRGGTGDDAWVTQLDKFQPYKALPPAAREYIRAVVAVTKEEQLGLIKEKDKYTAGQKAQERIAREQARRGRYQTDVGAETSHPTVTHPESDDEHRSRSGSRASSVASRRSVRAITNGDRRVGNVNQFDMGDDDDSH